MHFPCYFHASKASRTSAILILLRWLAYMYDVSRQVGTDTGSDTDISPHISPQIEIVAKDLQGLSTEIWPYYTGHSYRANITIDS